MLVSTDVQKRFCGFLMAKAWIVEELTELFLLNPASQQALCACVCARVRIRTCPTSWAWLRACFVRCQPRSLKAKHSSDRNHTLCLIWLCLQSEQFVFALHQWAHQQLSSPLSPSAPTCVRVCALVCISVYSTEHTWTWRTLVFLCVCAAEDPHSASRRQL